MGNKSWGTFSVKGIRLKIDNLIANEQLHINLAYLSESIVIHFLNFPFVFIYFAEDNNW